MALEEGHCYLARKEGVFAGRVVYSTGSEVPRVVNGNHYLALRSGTAPDGKPVYIEAPWLCGKKFYKRRHVLAKPFGTAGGRRVFVVECCPDAPPPPPCCPEFPPLPRKVRAIITNRTCPVCWDGGIQFVIERVNLLQIWDRVLSVEPAEDACCGGVYDYGASFICDFSSNTYTFGWTQSKEPILHCGVGVGGFVYYPITECQPVPQEYTAVCNPFFVQYRKVGLCSEIDDPTWTLCSCYGTKGCLLDVTVIPEP